MLNDVIWLGYVTTHDTKYDVMCWFCAAISDAVRQRRQENMSWGWTTEYLWPFGSACANSSLFLLQILHWKWHWKELRTQEGLWLKFLSGQIPIVVAWSVIGMPYLSPKLPWVYLHQVHMGVSPWCVHTKLFGSFLKPFQLHLESVHSNSPRFPWWLISIVTTYPYLYCRG